MRKTEIVKLENKDLQLRYFLGGLKIMNDNEFCHYWRCDIDCSCNMVPDDNRLEAVKTFIKNHNITNERFLRLAYNYLIGAIMKYKGEYSGLFIELEEVLKPYNFSKIYRNEVPANDFREKELEELVDDPDVKKYIEKFNLTKEDFIAIAKTSLNYNFYGLQLSNVDDRFINEVRDITIKHGLSVPREFIEEYRKEYKSRKESAELIAEVRSTRKRYLEAIKQLLISDRQLATEIINDDLKELKKIKKS